MLPQAPFAVSDTNELNALFRALIQAKFQPAIPDRDLSGSPFVVAMIERIFEAVRNEAIASGNETMVSNCDRWKRAEENPILVAAVRERIRECPQRVWSKWSREERTHFVQQLLSPLHAEEPLIKELLNETPGA
ncbi:hypothetical protein [Azonexus sp. R2A61]|uniref:hypothetical protein n=1 Tax=Azonexus sp. R2A61 TaxID=2744443 RepID=UPI001F2A49C9|nr:hypothetical protein [Azonexus sp. R2A61]